MKSQGFRACGRDKGAMKTDEVCGRPLDPFALHTPCFLDIVAEPTSSAYGTFPRGEGLGTRDILTSPLPHKKEVRPH